MSTVVITDYEFPDLHIEKQIFNEAGIEVVIPDQNETNDFVQLASEVQAEALLVQYSEVTSSVFEQLGNLEVVGKYGIGTDNIDHASATERGVVVLNVPDYCQAEVAEHTIGLILSCERKYHRYNEEVKKGIWDYKVGKPIHRLSGKTIGVIGCGQIGKTFVQKVRGFEFHILGFDPLLSPDELQEAGIEAASFEEVLSQSDIVTLHVPLTNKTKGMIDEKALKSMKSSSILINTSRGAVVDTRALTRALENDEIRAAALDVLPEEPPADSPLVDRDDVLLTPHMAWYSEDSIVQLRKTIAQDITRVLRDDSPRNIVNPSVRQSSS